MSRLLLPQPRAPVGGWVIHSKRDCDCEEFPPTFFLTNFASFFGSLPPSLPPSVSRPFAPFPASACGFSPLAPRA